MNLRILTVIVSCIAASTLVGAESKVDFQKDIQPILSEHCAQCHGVDAGDRQAELRLDVRDGALRGGESGEAAIVPGDAKNSSLFQRVTSTDADLLMPPTDHKKPLSASQIRLLERWIEEGAEYAAHWAFVAPQKAKVSRAENRHQHAIDQLVNAKLSLTELKPNSKADDAILCRRLYLDLIGLPPSPQQVAAFRKNGFEATVESLLQSERFGEKWARHWLDVARYSDTNGYEKDRRREQWAWRDWVINAMNHDLPYDQFIVEQIAGDLLPDPTDQQIIATGFLRNSMLNEEGAIVAEQFRMFEMFDRLDCIGKAVLGLTTQCAQCHTHKYDPITHDEYYGMFAFINNAYEAHSPVYNQSQQDQIRKTENEIERLRDTIKTKHPDWQQQLTAWIQETKKQLVAWTPLEPFEMGSISGLNHPTQLADKSILMLGHTSSDVFFLSKPDLQNVTGLRLEVLNQGDLPYRGPGRSSVGAWEILELEAFIKKPADKGWTKLPLTNATADYSQPDESSDDKKKASGPVAYLIDGNDQKKWKADRGTVLRNQPSVAVVQFEKPLDAPVDSQLKIALRMGNMVGCCRISTTKAKQPTVPAIDHGAILSLDQPAAQRTDQQNELLFDNWAKTLSDCRDTIQQITDQWKQFPAPMTSVLHLAERQGIHQRATRLLNRGEWDQPKHAVKPHTPKVLHAMHNQQDEPDRLAFARWLASDRSPLTARVAVNRVWQAIFGDGLVETPEDFGTRAALPKQLELLDWLAVEFMENEWSRKHLIRTIVTSDVYCRSSKTTQRQYDLDPKNQWLARGPRFRCEAEVVRDIALTCAGLITNKLNGPPIIPPVPQNVLDYNYVYPSYWKPTEGADRYRRTLYGFRKRSMPDPVMSNFDGPNGDISCARRIRSNTPLAALTGLNETIFVEAARAMALRVMRESGATDEQRIDYAFQLCTSRPANDSETSEIMSLIQSQRKRFADGWLNPREVVSGDAAKLPNLPENTTPQTPPFGHSFAECC